MTIRTIRRMLPPGDYDVITDEEAYRWIVVLGLPSDFDANVGARAVWIRRRDGDDRAAMRASISVFLPAPWIRVVSSLRPMRSSKH